MPDAIPAITLYQPWASLVAIGAQPFEFRSWPAPRKFWGRRVAIHAGARTVRKHEVRDLLLQLHSLFWRETCLERELAIRLLTPTLISPDGLPLSSVVCLATLGEPIRNNELTRAAGLPEVNDSDRGEHTNWGWPLSDVEVLRPFIPARGRQGWWMWERVNA